MPLLAIDTCAENCSVAILDCDSASIISEVTENIGRGHAEILMGQIEGCLKSADISYNNLRKIAVTVGPGSFTGVRVGLATARGLALGLSIPIIGVSTLDASEQHAVELGGARPIAVLLNAKRDQAFCKLPDEAQEALDYATLVDKLSDFDGAICGSGAREYLTRSGRNVTVLHEESVVPISTIARLANTLPVAMQPPDPIYLRSADAKKQTGFALERAES